LDDLNAKLRQPESAPEPAPEPVIEPVSDELF